MAEYQFHEMGDFYVTAHAIPKQEGRWAAFAHISRKSDSGKRLAPAVRLQIERDFGSESDALTAAAGDAAQTIMVRETGL